LWFEKPPDGFCCFLVITGGYFISTTMDESSAGSLILKCCAGELFLLLFCELNFDSALAVGNYFLLVGEAILWF